MTQVLLAARLDAITALLAAVATADALRQVELVAAAQYHLGLLLRQVVLDAREHHTVRDVAAAAGLGHSVLIRQVHAGGPLAGRPGRTYHRSDSRNAAPEPTVELPRAG
jgi:hypothetical protein